MTTVQIITLIVSGAGALFLWAWAITARLAKDTAWIPNLWFIIMASLTFIFLLDTALTLTDIELNRKECPKYELIQGQFYKRVS